MEIVPGHKEGEIHDQGGVSDKKRPVCVNAQVQASPLPDQKTLERDEQERIGKRVFELNLRKAKLGWPWERIRQAEEVASIFKAKWFDLGPKIEEAISTVHGHRQVNQQLMMLTDEYINFKKKANDKYVQMSQVIERQKHEHRDLL